MSNDSAEQRPFDAYDGDEPYAFVCYSHQDIATVYPELRWLHGAGIHLWYDEGISVGHEWTQDLAEAVEACSKFLYFVTPASVATKHCRNEVQFALDHEKDLVLVHLEKTDVPPGLQLATGLTQALHRYELTERAYRQKLLEALRRRAGLEVEIRQKRSRRRLPFYGSLLLLVLAVTLAGAWLSTRQPMPTRDDAYAAEQYFLGRDYLRQWATEEALQSAVARFNASIAADPSAARSRAGLCEAELLIADRYGAAARMRNAEAACTDAVGLDEGSWEVQRALGVLLTAKGDHERALVQLGRALTQQPQRASIHASIGRTHGARGSLPDAVAALTRAIELEPGYWGWQVDMGSLYYRYGRYDRSTEHLEQALALAPPDSVPLLNNLGAAYFMLDDFENAERVWQDSLATYPTTLAHESLANMRFYQGCVAHSANGYRNALRLDPTRPATWGNFAQTCALLPGGAPAAKSAFQQAIHLANAASSLNESELGQLAVYYAYLDADDLARRSLARLFDEKAETAASWYWAAIAYHVLDDDEAAAEARAKSMALGMPASIYANDPRLNDVSCPLPPAEPACELDGLSL